MIAKHVPMRSLGKSDFAGLVNYITDEQSKEHRLGAVRLTNCEAYSVQDAVSEVLATQFANTRAKSDKTYHLIVSFRAGEQVKADTLVAIEDRICKGLGFGEHQRISAVHNDTDNLHIHIAVNKIHPTRNIIHEPYYPHQTLAELCEVMERDYGLQQDNHMPRRRGAEARATDMERHAGIESLIGWIKRECLDDIKTAQSWAELHQVMRDNGLELRARGNGLVVVAGDDAAVKASTLGRNFSKPKLEARFGPFEPDQAQQGKPHRQYRKDPVRLRVNTTELYARFKSEQQSAAANKTAALDKARRQKDRRIENAKKKGKARRATIKLTSGRLTKKVLYAQASSALKADIDAIQKQYREERQAIHEAHGRRTWADWLKREALQGDIEALAALRAREAAQGLKGNTLKGEGQAKPGHAPVIDNVTKKGTIIYRAGASAVRDDGDRLQVSRESDQAGIQNALRMAMERYGERITVNGSPEFKARVIKAAADGQLPIRFADAGLERRRQALANGENTAPAKTRSKRAGVPPIGQPPPPVRRNRLQSLSQADVLHLEGQTGKTPTPPLQRPSEQERRKANLRAEMDAKRAKRQQKGRSL
ncbi:TraI/MobA(P) family conjugative relaxase [Halomonas huangheensis]|uniref:Conjugal transfer protein TrbI n=1 Tax=Halomonas huangheensis TaxID=1178482 RepID=W1NAK5_9GAMM|nr:TraI/MobA(P) family conjugative relaxase [Halomonas huangheensis]ALM53396.1 conjugal transfer protein TrbI [Halomonas huangheensis]ERL51950.1 conjugal transfer protein TrbI [Halomonas huangheensis]